MQKPTQEKEPGEAPRFPRKVSEFKAKKTGRAKLRKHPHAMK